MRDITQVIEKIIREIPQKWEQRAFVTGRLRSISNSARYTAPELMQQRWNQVAVVLETWIGEPDEEWKRKIATIFAGRDSI